MKLIQKHRIYPNEFCKIQLAKQEGCNRKVWNETLAHMRRLGHWLSYYEMCAFLTHTLKPMFPFLREVGSQSLVAVLKDLDLAIKASHRKIVPSNPPRFKKRSWRNSCRFPQFVKADRERSFIYLPKMMKHPIKIILERELPDYTMVTIVKESDDRYYACFIIEKECVEHVKWIDMEHVGIDVGITSFAIMSNGQIIDNPKFFKESEKYIARKQKGLSTKTKGSRAYKKWQKAVARAYAKIKRKRADWIHKLTTKIANDNSIEGVGVEFLSITKMLEDKKFSKSISDASWGLFIQCLDHKLSMRGKSFTQIDKGFASTQICSNTACHKKTGPKGEKDLGVRNWTCTACGSTHDRDLNAAINIGKRADWLYGSYAA